jgi:hypothetical protein
MTFPSFLGCFLHWDESGNRLRLARVHGRVGAGAQAMASIVRSSVRTKSWTEQVAEPSADWPCGFTLAEAVVTRLALVPISSIRGRQAQGTNSPRPFLLLLILTVLLPSSFRLYFDGREPYTDQNG